MSGFLRKLCIRSASKSVEDVVGRCARRRYFFGNGGYALGIFYLERQVVKIVAESSNAAMYCPRQKKWIVSWRLLLPQLIAEMRWWLTKTSARVII